MKIILEEQYKSLAPFQQEIPDFCIVTGRNGTGKSQLIELIDSLNNNSWPRYKFRLDPKPSRIQVGGLNPVLLNAVTSDNWHAKIAMYWNDYTANVHFMKVLKKLFLEVPDLVISEISFDDFRNLIFKYAIDEAIEALMKAGTSSDETKAEDYAHDAAAAMHSRKEGMDVARYVSKKAKKNIDAIRQEDYYRFPPTEHMLGGQHLFYTSLDVLFYSHAKRRNLNFIYMMANEKLGKDYDYEDDASFLRNNPAPWAMLNEIFERHEIPYFFEEIPPDRVIDSRPIYLTLIKKTTGHAVTLSNLSSGEKIIVTLIVSLFMFAFYGKKIDKPDLIVLDEPDSHLHPQMSKLLLSVLCETFVKEIGLKVIMTTHSPSTVAMASEECIYEMQNEPTTTLNKVTKDRALKLLTYGVPSLSIDYKNHRQVFVESTTDLYYYQELFNRDYLDNPYQLKPYFISAGSERSNSTQVMKLVDDLRGAGNDKAFGIVDWDLKHKTSESIFVHGEGVFYSIENCLYSPIYLVMLFIQHGAENVEKELSLPLHTKFYDIGNNKSNETLQRYSDWLMQKILNRNINSVSKDSRIFSKCE